MPQCTGKPDIIDIWTCPFCKPKYKVDGCFQTVEAPWGMAQIPCTSKSCTRAGYKTHDCGVYYQHLVEAHSFPNTPELNAEYAKLLASPALTLEELPDPRKVVGRGGKSRTR